MKKARFQYRPEVIMIALVCVAVGVGGMMRLRFASDAARSPVDAAESDAAPASDSDAIAFQSPMVSASWQLQNAGPGLLLGSTSSEERLASVEPGRFDPFAPLVQLPSAPKPKPATAELPAAPQAVAAAPQTVTAPIPTGASLPPVPQPVATQAAPPSLPAIPLATQPVTIPALPDPAAFTPVQGIELTGVAQVGDRVSVIVREPGSSTSRYTFAGDYLASGRVLLKRIDMSTQEPLVILEYQGREYSYGVGSTAPLGLS